MLFQSLSTIGSQGQPYGHEWMGMGSNAKKCSQTKNLLSSTNRPLGNMIN